MKILLVIPKLYYKMLLDRSAMLWPEYRALKNGILMRNDTGQEEIHIVCDSHSVQLILNFAGRVCSEAIPHIQQFGNWAA
jgi:hypothetical protein